MSEIEDQIDVITYIHLRQQLDSDKNMSNEVKELTQTVIYDIIDELKDRQNAWCEKWK